jgi:hypothetical protein
MYWRTPAFARRVLAICNGIHRVSVPHAQKDCTITCSLCRQFVTVAAGGNTAAPRLGPGSRACMAGGPPHGGGVAPVAANLSRTWFLGGWASACKEGTMEPLLPRTRLCGESGAPESQSPWNNRMACVGPAGPALLESHPRSIILHVPDARQWRVRGAWGVCEAHVWVREHGGSGALIHTLSRGLSRQAVAYA